MSTQDKSATDQSSLRDDETGATAIEYALIAALASLTIFNAVRGTGRRTRRSLNCTRRTVNRARRGRAPPGCAG
ncbi:MAG: Flp family type IVb pilin [Pseudomonadota bacterium]